MHACCEFAHGGVSVNDCMWQNHHGDTTWLQKQNNMSLHVGVNSLSVLFRGEKLVPVWRPYSSKCYSSCCRCDHVFCWCCCCYGCCCGRLLLLNILCGSGGGNQVLRAGVNDKRGEELRVPFRHSLHHVIGTPL